jgi:hypothetical protein
VPISDAKKARRREPAGFVYLDVRSGSTAENRLAGIEIVRWSMVLGDDALFVSTGPNLIADRD